VNSEPTLGEIARRLDRVERQLDALVTRDLYTSTLAAIDQRLGTLEEAHSSLVKLIIGAFVAVLVQMVFLGVSVFTRGIG
jgi:hypothetical protein